MAQFQPVTVSAQLSHTGPRAGADVPQLYLSFPASVPGPAAAKPEWRLRGFQKLVLESSKPQRASFSLSLRDLSYWDDSPGKSEWVCAAGKFRACIGANARDAIAAEQGGACTTFTAPC